MPLETVWADNRLDLSRTRAKRDVSTGYTRFRDGDVLVPKVTPTFQAGRSAIVRGLRKGVGAGSTELHVLRPKPEVDARFLRYVVMSAPFLSEGVTAFQGVAGLQRVPDDFLRDFPVAEFSLEEQRCIADFLDAETSRIDTLSRLTSRQADLLQGRFAEYLRSMTTRGNNREMVSTGVSWMPEMAWGWKLHRLGRVFHTGSGTTPKADDPDYFGDGHPWVNTGDLRDTAISNVGKNVTDLALRTYSALRIYEAGALVVAMYGATVGRVGMLSFSACVNQACCVLYRSTVVDSEFLFNWFIAHRKEILGLASGGGQANISQDLIRSLRVPSPVLSVQQEILAEIRSQRALFERQVAGLSRRLDLLAEHRQALITAAVTGQLDVTTARSGVR